MKRGYSARNVAFIVLFLLAALFSRASHAQNYCDPSYSFLPAGRKERLLASFEAELDALKAVHLS